MILPFLRKAVVLLAGAGLVVAAVAHAAGGSSEGQGGARAFAPAALSGATVFRSAPLARAAADYRGGRITTSTGESVDVRVSDALPADSVTPEGWAEFLAGLTHGPELSQLTVYILTLDEVQQVCGSQALGCYARDQLVAPGETAFDTTPEEIVRHEYGHHVAYHRTNTPWPAIDWGPKRWASAANVCARVARSQAYPGNEGTNYTLNPGEAWAETYRVLQERAAGITTSSWSIVDSSFFPTDAALAAARQDVAQPWTGPTTRTFTRVFGKRTARVWWIPLSTPLDGDYRIAASVPATGTVDVALVAANRSTVLRRAQWVGQRSKTATGSICGQRSLFVRVTQAGASGRVRVAVTTP